MQTWLSALAGIPVQFRLLWKLVLTSLDRSGEREGPIRATVMSKKHGFHPVPEVFSRVRVIRRWTGGWQLSVPPRGTRKQELVNLSSPGLEFE